MSKVTLSILLDLLVKKGLVTKRQAKSIGEVDDLVVLLETSSRIPPFSEEESLIIRTFKKVAKAKFLSNKKTLLYHLKDNVTNPSLRDGIFEIINVLEKLDNEN